MRSGEFHHAMDLLGALRLCANVPGQFAIEAALHGADTITELCQPGGRLYEARRAVVESCAARETSGRASGRVRGCQDVSISGGARPIKKKNTKITCAN